MKRCPKCSEKFYDESLVFCLEDGSRLLETEDISDSVPIVKRENTTFADDFETEILHEIPTKDADLKSLNKTSDTLEIINKTNKISTIKEKATQKGFKILEVLPIIFALFHNYWHWLYFDKAKFSSVWNFLTSGIFIVWILLFFAGIVTSLLAFKFGKDKRFVIIALVILAINLLLGIVPLK